MAYPDDTKRCGHCKLFLGISEFGNNVRFPDGLQPDCKKCRRKQSKEYHERHKDQVNAAHREDYALNKDIWRPVRLAYAKRTGHKHTYASRKRHPETNRIHSKAYSARKRGAVSDRTVTVKSWEDLCRMYHFMCLACQEVPVELTQDHIVPISQGGMHSLDNLQPLCRPCNSSKGTKVVDYR